MLLRWKIAALLFCSGLCALVYQVAWLREMRLVFGASTPASAAVLAVFMGGLGYGSLVLGKRAEASARPLLLYARLELGIAACAALTPLLLLAARAGYVALGGTTALGMLAGTLLRLVLAALVLLPPTLLMGGTLPAAARAATGREDAARTSTALLYGANTLGAVAGAAASTFILLEVLGTRLTLWLGCGINALVAMAARAASRRLPPLASEASAPSEPALEERGPLRPATAWVLVCAAVVGFAFLLMELVWYRMLSPLLGGSTYTFGLVLSVALLGIGMGGALYGLRPAARPASALDFALVCALEAVALCVPYALGDRLAVLALVLRGFGFAGLLGQAAGWAAVAALVVLPAAIVAGYQFPLLISLLGTGRPRVGRDVGLAYASNTAGSIGGSLCGGFLLLPWLGALGAWKLAIWLLALLAVAAAGASLCRRAGAGPVLPARLGAALGPAAIAAAGLWLAHAALGPTAAWRHSGIGAARAGAALHDGTRNGLRRWLHEQRLAVTWEQDGRESNVALATLNDTGFLLGGKSDGSALLDSARQVTSGLLAALLHGRVERALVVGLGTGTTAGWLAAVPEIERVDVIELEPAVLHVARECAAVNRDVLAQPRIHVSFGDAREALLTTRARYDLILSEPSSPYRAGVASLFSREFYAAARQRLRPGGIFAQWVQAYEIDAAAIRTVYATLAAEFAQVQTWRTDVAELMLVATQEDRPLDIMSLRRRIGTEPFRSGLLFAWRATSVEDLLARHVAAPSFARAVAERAGEAAISTDDLNGLEFGVARSLGRAQLLAVEELRHAAARLGAARPELAGATEPIDWERVSDARMALGMVSSWSPAPLDPGDLSAAQRHRYRALLSWSRADAAAAVAAWRAQERDPRGAVELMVMADSFAALGDEPAAAPLIDRLAALMPTEASAVAARLRWAQGRRREALDALRVALLSYQRDPWASIALMYRALGFAQVVGRGDAAAARELYALLGTPFPVSALRYQRQWLRLELAAGLGDMGRCIEALGPFEPHVPWDDTLLVRRALCYGRAHHPLAARAAADLAAFREAEGPSIEAGLVPEPDESQP